MQRRTDHLISISGQSLAYGIGQFGRGVVIYLALPVITRLLGQVDYGIVAVMVSFVSFTDVLSDAGIPAATLRLYNDSEDGNYRARVLGSSLFLFMLYALVMAVAIWALAGPLAGWLLDDSKYAGLMRIGAAVMVMLTAISFGQIMYRVQVRPLNNSASDLVLIFAQTGLALGLVGLFSFGVYGYWWGQLIGAALTTLFVAFTLRRSLHFSISKDQLKGLMIYALPLIPASMAAWALRLADRPIILHFYNLQDVAIYELGYKIASMLQIAIAPFNLAWPQFAYSRMRDQDAPRLFRDVLTGLTAACVFLGLGVFALRRELVLFFGSAQYLGAMPVITLVLVGQIALALFPILSVGPRISKRTSQIAWIGGTSATVNIILNLVLLPRFGIVGAAIATMLAYVLQAAMAYVVGRREYDFPLDYVRLAKLFVAAAVSAGFVMLVERTLHPSLLSLCAKSLSIPLFVGMLFASGFVKVGQLRGILRRAVEMLQQRRNGANYVETEGQPS